jgi:hypothetical protein
MRFRIAVVLLAFPLGAHAQVASTYLDRYREIKEIAPDPGRVADVTGLVLRRDVGELVLERGKLYLLSNVGGRTVGAAFKGVGRFRFAPSLAVEQEQVQRFNGTPSLDDPITRATLLFTDSTWQQLAGLSFVAGEVPGDVRGDVRELIDWLKGEEEGAFTGTFMGPLLNGETSQLFLAHIRRAQGDPLVFQLDPQQSEAVALLRPVNKARWGSNWALTAQFPLGRPLQGSSRVWGLRHRLSIPHYKLDVRLTPTGTGDLDFVASATLALKAEEPIGPWLRLGLDRKLKVDSASWGNGAVTSAFKAKDDDDVWVRADRRLEAGDSLMLTLYYHGDLIDRYGNFFFIDPSDDWWPTNRQGQDRATFEITYHSPSWYPLASVGERVDSTRDDKVMTTRWVTKSVSPYATFNLGLFEDYRVDRPGEPRLNILLSEDAHRFLRQQAVAEGGLLLEQRNMRENVAADVSNSLKWFTHVFGPPPLDHYWITEIPYAEGVSFPGVIHLSWFTFSEPELASFQEFFRAHEVAHQWWGNAVRPATYRDVWLSEGLASFAGLWYMQTLRKRNDEYYKFLDQYANGIRDVREKAGPIWLGYRNASGDAPGGYQAIVYKKGAWVLHMLRTLMLDLQTRKEDRFIAMMSDYYSTFTGRSVTTDDFQRVVEQHIGTSMNWFFDQWVRGTAIPTYHVAWKNEPAEGNRQRVRLRITQEGVPAAFQAYVLVSADLGNNQFANFRVRVNGSQTEYVGPLLPVAAKGITFNELRSVLADVKMERW